jgi:glycolate oxidase iron-sulfur subunit
VVSLQLQNTLAAEEQKLVACIHCGLCLEACPTYVITGDENDGPRGRLYLMRAVAEGRLANTSEAFKKHIDRCLGCRACEQVCPAGVEYGQLLEASREELLLAQPQNDLPDRLLRFALRHIWSSPIRLRLFFKAARIFRDLGISRLFLGSGLARLFSKRAEFAVALLESSRPKQAKIRANKPSNAPRQTGNSRETVLLFSGCVGEGLFKHVNRATVRVLEANGFTVKVPRDQVCCGALHAHAGDLEGARDLATKNVMAFSDDVTAIITNAGGCGAMLASYGHLLHDDAQSADAASEFSARVKDISQQLQSIDIKRGITQTEELVTYDASCHLLYGQRAADSSRAMLRSIPDLKFTELKGSERCCGGAGVYNLLQPEMSGRVLHEKLKNVADTAADVLTTGNPGCQMQIGAGACLAHIKLDVRHPVELLDESYERAGYYAQDK